MPGPATDGPRPPTARAERFERWSTRLGDTPETLARDAQKSLGTDQFYLAYQPRISCSDGEIRVAEALLRWNETTRGQMRPGTFLPSLSGTPIMGQLGLWILHQACAQAASWEHARPASAASVAVAVNLAAVEVLQPDFILHVCTAVEAAAIPSNALQIEVDVHRDLCRGRGIEQRLEELRGLGIVITLDGVSPAIAEEGLPLPCDSVNLERRHIRSIDTDPEGVDAVGAAIRFAHGRSVTVTAIGVERQAQADILVAAGCDQLQGFHFSEPVLPGDLGWVEDEALTGPASSGPAPRAQAPVGPANSTLPRRRSPNRVRNADAGARQEAVVSRPADALSDSV